MNLFSSQPTVGTVNSSLTIHFGQTQATGTFSATNNPGPTTITAQASDYSTGKATITTYLIDYSILQITLTANPQNVYNGNDTSITAYITANGNPVTGATVAFASNNGGTFSATSELGKGYYSTTFAAPSFSQTTTCTVTASASETGYLNGQATAQISVSLAPTPSATPISIPTPTPTPTPSSSTGTLQFLVVDNGKSPLSNAIVTSTANSLVDQTNSTGYATFKNLTAGSYSFQIIKDGYPQKNETIDFNGQPLLLTVTLNNNIITGNVSGNTFTIIVVGIIAAVAIALVSLVMIVRRKKSTNIKKLQEVQKQLRSKYETPKKT